MKLLMVNHPIKGIAYFTSAVKAAAWLDTPVPYVYKSMKNGKTVKGATLEWIEDDTILPHYIDPNNTATEKELLYRPTCRSKEIQ